VLESNLFYSIEGSGLEKRSNGMIRMIEAVPLNLVEQHSFEITSSVLSF
jgi:hypothetical protein